MTTDHITTLTRDVHVIRGPSKLWTVAQEGHVATSANYRVRAHAIAFARAVAFAAHADMIVHEPAGRSTRHPRASLSYPTSLD
ncbi:DUF2188 domain-containing protein [Hyphomicrobium sp.]|uniref:DUF2188 domain-containing protein n=1 Tax=Hyphomicrobium sp. TaxID=82 RepID=UPI002E348F31|nr:DUF2188 domain-containing protein [Hyphomicrobium sp.]HEX2839649.1 DUF2188 domain-containing protein [Hyphomicrobium sp.]